MAPARVAHPPKVTSAPSPERSALHADHVGEPSLWLLLVFAAVVGVAGSLLWLLISRI
jgi:hypothetical protein